MPGYLTAAAKATSTVCLLWSAYLIARARAHRKRHITPVSDFDETSVIDSKRSDPFKACSLELDDPLHSPSFSLNADDRPHSVDTATRMFSLLHRSWSAVARLLYDASESSQLISPSQTFSMDKLSFYASFVTELAEKTHLTPEPSFGRKVGRLYSPTRSRTMLAEELLRRLVTYTKSDEFLNILLRDSRFPGLLEFLIRLTLSSYRPPAQTQEENPNVLFEQPSMSDESTAGSSHSQYPISLLVATILANASRNPWDTEELLKTVRPEFENLLSMWCNSSSLQLLLLGSKIRYNLDATHARVSKSDGAEPTRFRPVYYPDIFRLDKLDQSCASDPEKDECDLDVVFVHGMWGSVFYTWRQSEHPNKTEGSTPSTCWPRDWLSSEFPRARVLGIDTSLSPFIWNPICPIDRFKRTLDSRARALLPQLKAAGVGKRPVIWVTHSAGGILVKEVLRLSKHGDMNPSETETSRIGSQSALDVRFTPENPFNRSEPIVSNPVVSSVSEQSDVQNVRKRKRCHNFTVPADTQSFHQYTDDCTDNPDLAVSNISSPSRPLWHRAGTASENLQQLESVTAHPTLNDTLADSTRGVVFMSVPHRGNQSLCAMYWWPLRWALTPEAIQLERDSPYLLDLHSWFNLWAMRRNIRVLTMTEQRVTPVNRHCSVLLVPEDIRDREMGEVVRIDSDHMYISKPHSPTDPTYVNIVNFIHQTMRDCDITPNSTAQTGQCNGGVSSSSSDGNSTTIPAT